MILPSICARIVTVFNAWTFPSPSRYTGTSSRRTLAVATGTLSSTSVLAGEVRDGFNQIEPAMAAPRTKIAAQMRLRMRIDDMSFVSASAFPRNDFFWLPIPGRFAHEHLETSWLVYPSLGI